MKRIQFNSTYNFVEKRRAGLHGLGRVSTPVGRVSSLRRLVDHFFHEHSCACVVSKFLCLIYSLLSASTRR